MSDVIRLFGPLLLWLAAFSAIYGLQGVVCAQGMGHTVVLAAWGLAVLLQGAVLAVLATRRFGAPSRFVRRVSMALAGVALVAVVWTLAPVAFLPACV